MKIAIIGLNKLGKDKRKKMRVIIDLDDKYASVFSFTAIGNELSTVNVAVCCVELKKGNKIKVNKDGKYVQSKEDD